MKTLAVILFIASAALNIGFLTGCQSLHDAVYGSPCEFVPSAPKQDETADLARIAGRLDIKTSGKTASDLVADICYKLDRSMDVPKAFDESAFNEATKDLLSGEKEILRKYQQFISDLQGKRVIVIERKD